MEKAIPRDDILPVILSGDNATYPLAREFFEAYGVTSKCLVPDPMKVVAYSRFIDVIAVPDMDIETLRGAILELAAAHPDKRLIVIANSDKMIELVARIAADVPENVLCACAPLDVMLRASNKLEFAEICESFGLDTPRTEVVSLGGAEPPAASEIPFPVVVKPAVSSEYTHLQFKGFQKVYFFEGQDELDRLWSELRAAGFEGTMLVQELIEGDDSCIGSITMYVDRNGEVALESGARVILEDHSPALYGNPVAMITCPMPELFGKVGAMLSAIGWRGFANFDLKWDPKTGRALFMDFNPRIGANSYYNAAAGLNPMQILVEDLVDAKSSLRSIEEAVLHIRTPTSLARRYISDPELLAQFDAIVSAGKVFNPMVCPKDSLRSQLMGRLAELNYVRKFAKYYPKQTGQAF